MMVVDTPSIAPVFKILVNQGWHPVSADMPRMLQRGLKEGYRIVTDTHVRTYGVFPMQAWSYTEFLALNSRDLF